MSKPAVQFPDGVAVVRAALLPLVTPVPIEPSVPNPRPDRFYRMTRVGGVRRDIVTDRPMILVEAYAPTAAEAHDLASAALMHLHTLQDSKTEDGVAIGRVDEVGGVANDPDPISDQERHRFTVEITLRGSTPT